MASEELDPTFRRALNLLHSTSVDSAQQLKLMLDEAIKTRREQGAQSEDQVVAPRSLTEGYKPEVINRVTEVATPRTHGSSRVSCKHRQARQTDCLIPLLL